MLGCLEVTNLILLASVLAKELVVTVPGLWKIGDGRSISSREESRFFSVEYLE